MVVLGINDILLQYCALLKSGLHILTAPSLQDVWLRTAISTNEKKRLHAHLLSLGMR